MPLCLLIQPIHRSGIALLEKEGLTVRQATKPDMETVSREIGQAVAAITRNSGLSRMAMDAAPNLKVLGNHGIGTDPVDVAYASEIGLPVVFTPFGNVQSVAELAISQMLAVARHTRDADKAVRTGNFDYRYSRTFVELHGKTLAVIGFGRIGRRTAEIAKAAFGMRILAYGRQDAETLAAAGAEKIDDLDAILTQADVISLHLPLTLETRNIISRDRLLHRMKKGAILINTARGALIDAEGLVEALESGHLFGAAMDVFETEPLPTDHPFARTERLLLSPHIGGATEESLERTALQTAQQVIQVLRGIRPPHLVNFAVWDRRR